jgi:hypothetical protein
MVTEAVQGCSVLAVPSPYGEVVDRLTILALKAEHLPAGEPRGQVEDLHDALDEAWSAAGLPPWRSLPEHAELAEVNAALWNREDTLRRLEAAGEFGPEFVAQARGVYRLNDRRAALKTAIDRRLGSPLQEPKVYAADPRTS